MRRGGSSRPKQFGDALEQGALRGAFGELAAERLAGIVEGVIDEVALFAALGAARCRRGEPARVVSASSISACSVELVAEEHEARRGAVLVELADEGLEHFGLGERGVGARAEGVVAPVLEGAEEEDLHAELAAFLVDGEDVGLLDGLGGDVALALDQRQRREAIAEQGGALEIELLGGGVHVGLRGGPAPTCDLPERNWRASSTSSP